MADHLPIFPLNTVLYPGMPLPLHIFEERYRRMLRIRAGEDPAFGVVLLQSGAESGGPAAVHAVGTAAHLVSRRQRADGRSDIVVTGTRRFRIQAENWSAGYCIAEIAWLDELVGDGDEVERLMRAATDRFGRYVRGITRITGRRFTGVRISNEPTTAAYDLISRLPLHTWERQKLLELETTQDRLREVGVLIERELNLLYRAGVAGLAINHPAERFVAN